MCYMKRKAQDVAIVAFVTEVVKFVIGIRMNRAGVGGDITQYPNAVWFPIRVRDSA